MTNPVIHKSDIVYHTRILPTVGIYDLDELKIRTVTETYFIGVEKSGTKPLFYYHTVQ